MNTDKKNQHYIPKFYLRKFSFQGNQKEIGLFNLSNEIFVARGKLKKQGSKNFYYGTDGVIEDSLCDIEGHLSPILDNIIKENKLPVKNSKEHFELLYLLALTDLRNPIKINWMKNISFEIKKCLKQDYPDANTEKLAPEITHEKAISISLGNTILIAKIMADLNYKILVNNTTKPFITSDYPAVKYNQYLENKKWPGSKSGYGVTGLQIFLPLNSTKVLSIYDSGIYKIGNKRENIVTITDTKDIDSINMLQYVNCFSTIFFDDKANEQYIRNLYLLSKKYQRANTARAKLSYLIKKGSNYEDFEKKGQKNLLVMDATDCEIGLELSSIKIHSRGKEHKLNSTMAQLRPHADKLRKNCYNDQP